MNFNLNRLLSVFIFIISTVALAQKPIKVFILAGLSNMAGQGEMVKGEKGNLSWLVKSDIEGKHPVAARYNWSNHANASIYNSCGFPAVPFRTNNWDEVLYGE